MAAADWVHEAVRRPCVETTQETRCSRRPEFPDDDADTYYACQDPAEDVCGVANSLK